MYKYLFVCFCCSCLILAGCMNKQEAKVDGINVDVAKQRFERDFFQIDTFKLESSLGVLQKKYPTFYIDFRDRILGLATLDSMQKNEAIKRFYKDYKSIYDSSKNIDKGIDEAHLNIIKALKYVKYYFPAYGIPKQFITFIGPIDAFAYGETGGSGEIITNEALCSGIQLHLGSEFSLYKTDLGQQLYPAYISRKFTTDYIASNSIKNIIDDIFPPSPGEKTLLDILIDHGKRMYVLDLLMPFEADEIKLGYTTQQLKGARENEGYIWNFITEHNLLYEKDVLRIRSFVTDGPMTSELGIGSPGFISLFVGKKIVAAYMEKKPETSIQQLLETDAKQILAGSKYRPK